MLCQRAQHLRRRKCRIIVKRTLYFYQSTLPNQPE